jgi:dTMP kinase
MSDPTRGFFITLEGIDGSGKSTMAAMLSEHLAKAGYDVVATVDPGGDDTARAIRELILGRNSEMTAMTELLLFEACRAQNVEVVIRPALERGAVVVSDRFSDSSLAYQGSARGLGMELVCRLNDIATGGLSPDLTVLLDLDPRMGLGRQTRVDRIGSEGLYFHQRVREAYLQLAEAEPGRIVLVDASDDLDRVFRTVAEIVTDRVSRVFPLRAGGG